MRLGFFSQTSLLFSKKNYDSKMKSQLWFGVIFNETSMSSVYRRLVDLKGVSYRIVGKIRDNEDKICLIKFLIKFDREVEFLSIKEKGCDRLHDVCNTIIPVTEVYLQYFIDLIRKITYVEHGSDPITEKIIDQGEMYFSSDDSPYTTSDELDDESSDETSVELEEEVNDSL